MMWLVPGPRMPLSFGLERLQIGLPGKRSHSDGSQFITL